MRIVLDPCPGQDAVHVSRPVRIVYIGTSTRLHFGKLRMENMTIMAYLSSGTAWINVGRSPNKQKPFVHVGQAVVRVSNAFSSTSKKNSVGTGLGCTFPEVISPLR